MNNYFSLFDRPIFQEAPPERYINEFNHKETRGDQSWGDHSNVLIAKAGKQPKKDTDNWSKGRSRLENARLVGESLLPG